MKKILRIVLGILLIIIGLGMALTPATPGSWLALIGLELLGIRLLVQRKVLSFLPEKTRIKVDAWLNRLAENRWFRRFSPKQEQDTEPKDLSRATTAKLKDDPDYQLIIRFAEKYPNATSEEDAFKKLEALLCDKWKLDHEQVQQLVKAETAEQHKASIRHRLTAFGARTREEYLAGYLDLFGEVRESELPALLEILKELGMPTTPDSLKGQLEELATQMELQRFRSSLLNEPTSLSMSELRSLTGVDFERAVAELYRRMGYKVELTPQSGDQGADLIATKLGERLAVQAKQWAGPVGNSAVQEVAAAIRHYKAHRGVVVTTSSFTKSATDLAKSNEVELVDQDRLESLFKRFPTPRAP